MSVRRPGQGCVSRCCLRWKRKECGQIDESCYCCETCGSAWYDWFGEHPESSLQKV
jgi:hypothetical protein